MDRRDNERYVVFQSIVSPFKTDAEDPKRMRYTRTGTRMISRRTIVQDMRLDTLLGKAAVIAKSDLFLSK